MKTLADYIKAVELEEGTDLHAQAEDHLSKANDADAKGDTYGYHMHMTNHHEALSQWHDSKGRGGMAAKHEDLAAKHEDKAQDALDAQTSAMRSMRDRLKASRKRGVKEAYGGLRGNVGDRSKREFKHRELEHELGHEVNPRASFNRPSSSDVPHAVHINGKKWKTFGSQSHASNVARKIPGATVHKEEYTVEGMNDWALKDKPKPKSIPQTSGMNNWARKDIHNKAYDFPRTYYDKDGKDMFGNKKPEVK